MRKWLRKSYEKQICDFCKKNRLGVYENEDLKMKICSNCAIELFRDLTR